MYSDEIRAEVRMMIQACETTQVTKFIKFPTKAERYCSIATSFFNESSQFESHCVVDKDPKKIVLQLASKYFIMIIPGQRNRFKIKGALWDAPPPRNSNHHYYCTIWLGGSL